MLLGYVAGSFVTAELIAFSGVGQIFFAPAGFSAAAILLSPRRRWPVIALAVAIGELFVATQFGSHSAATVAGFILACIAEPLVGGTIVYRWRGAINLSRRADLKAFVVGSVITGPAVGAAIRAITVAATDGPFGAGFVSWWIGDALGVMLFAGLILGFFTIERGWATGWLETGAGLALTAASAGIVYWTTELPIGFLAVLPVATIAARSGTWLAMIASNIVAVIAFLYLVLTGYDVGGLPALGSTSSSDLVVVKLQLLCTAAAALLVAAESTERENLARQTGYQNETVRQLRNALAPASVIRTAHVEAEGISQCASERLDVGGDWYDIFEGDTGEVSIVIGDVVGHSEAAVVGMGKMRSAAAALAMRTSDTGLVLDWLDEYARSTEDRPYATAFFARFNPSTRTLTYSTAGHPPAMISRDDGTWEWLVGGRSTPIGVPFPRARPSATIELDGPCTLIVYTDGAVERAGEVIDTGLARVFDAVTRRPDASVDELLHEVTEETVRDDASFVRVRLCADD